MSENIQRLQALRDQLADAAMETTPRNFEPAFDADAVAWAIDQLRWRLADDTLPEDGQEVLAVDASGNCRLTRYIATADRFDDVYDTEFKFVIWWRPIDLPEGS